MSEFFSPMTKFMVAATHFPVHVSRLIQFLCFWRSIRSDFQTSVLFNDATRKLLTLREAVLFAEPALMCVQ